MKDKVKYSKLGEREHKMLKMLSMTVDTPAYQVVNKLIEKEFERRGLKLPEDEAKRNSDYSNS